MENSMEASRKLNIELLYDSVIILLGIYPKKMKSECQRHFCIPMLITAPLTIVKKWKQSKCTSPDEWIKKTWYIYTMEYYSAIKQNKNLSCVTTDGTGDHHVK
jgi:hypothetical protein